MAAPTLDVNGIGGELTKRFGDVATTVGEITDPASAERATATIGDATIFLKSLDVDNMSGTSRAMLGKFAAPAAAQIEGVATKVYEIPGVRSVLEPLLNPLLERLRAI